MIFDRQAEKKKDLVYLFVCVMEKFKIDLGYVPAYLSYTDVIIIKMRL